MAKGGDTTLFVSNLDGSDERYFLYDQVNNYITIGGLTKGAAVSKNPDGSYDVWAFDGPDNKNQDLTVPNGFEALKIVEPKTSSRPSRPTSCSLLLRPRTLRPRRPGMSVIVPAAAAVPLHRSSAKSSRSSATVPPASCSSARVPVPSVRSSERRSASGLLPVRFLQRVLLPWLALLLGLSCTASSNPTPPRIFGLYAVWFAGSGDADRAEIDRFLACLIDGSTLNQYWKGEARVELRGSFALPPPPSRLDWEKVAEQWLTPQVGAPSGLPVAQTDETPLYLIFGGQPDVLIGACGINSVADVEGRYSGVGFVRNSPLCWPTGNRVRTETQIAAHEIVETVDRALGYAACAADGSCEGQQICSGACDSFVGLVCPGAPTATPTGCGGHIVEGWVIQRLGYAGREPSNCEACFTCDVTPTICPVDTPQCGRGPGSMFGSCPKARSLRSALALRQCSIRRRQRCLRHRSCRRLLPKGMSALPNMENGLLSRPPCRFSF